MAFGGMALYILATNPGEVPTSGDWWEKIRDLRGEMGSDLLLGAPAATIVPAVITVIWAPPPATEGDDVRERWNQEAVIEFVRTALFIALLGTAVLAALAMVPGPGTFIAESLVGVFLLSFSSAMSATLRPQGVRLELRRTEARARRVAYERALAEHRERCVQAGVPLWMMSRGSLAGLGVRLWTVFLSGSPVVIVTLIIFVFEEFESGGTSPARIAKGVGIAILLGSMAGLSRLLVGQGGGDWRTNESSRNRWAELVTYLIAAVLYLAFLSVSAGGMWVASPEWPYRALTGLVLSVGILGFVWPSILKKSKITAALDHRCLLQREQLAKAQSRALEPPPGQGLGWPFSDG